VKKVSLVVPVIHAEAPAKGLDDKKGPGVDIATAFGLRPWLIF